MEVVASQEALLSNLEVLHFLREERQRQFGGRPGHKATPHRSSGANATILLETLAHLEAQACAQHTSEALSDFLEAVKPFGLSESEVLQLANQVPSSDVELHLLIEECEERLSEAQIERLLEIVSKCLTSDPSLGADEPADRPTDP
eukprot:snap_masked-scaffold631_size122145-processed-gene-0.26 protein:Tk01069 transcript:snap_masked-scaffold631_size122145-processed-gene-0.26-mRNA-1 annotation:"calcitonin gene-related peptide-receptor component protein"